MGDDPIGGIHSMRQFIVRNVSGPFELRISLYRMRPIKIFPYWDFPRDYLPDLSSHPSLGAYKILRRRLVLPEFLIEFFKIPCAHRGKERSHIIHTLQSDP